MNECNCLVQRVNFYGFKKEELLTWKQKIPFFSINFPEFDQYINISGNNMEEIDTKIKEMKEYFQKKYPETNVRVRRD